MTYYDLTGPDDAPALVLLHPASYCRQMWLPQTEAWRDEFRLLSVDAPGHGALAGEPFSFEAARRTVLRAMDETGVRRAVLVGVSLGGVLAMQLGARVPERVAGLALSGATFDATGRLCRLILSGEGVVFPRGAAWFTRCYHRAVGRRYPAAMAQAMCAPGMFWDAAAAVLAMRGVDFLGDYAAYPGPSLLVNGRRDWVHRWSERAYARASRNVIVHPIPGAGHVANIDRPAKFAAVVAEFARRAWREAIQTEEIAHRSKTGE